MGITINGQPLNDGDPLLVNGVQAQEVTVNGQQVWRNTIAPSPIQNLIASVNRVGSILVTFTHSTGLPTPQHDLYMNNLLVASNISTGYLHTIQGGDYSVFIRAHNTAGATDSNTVSARSQVAAGSEVFTATRNWTVIPGVKTATVCACGGGGAGANWPSQVRGGGGGGSGSTASATPVVLIPGAIVNVTIGLGGTTTATTGNTGGTTTVAGAGINQTITRVGAQGGGTGVPNNGGTGVNGGGNGSVGDPWTAAGASSGCGGSYAGISKPDNSWGGTGGSGGYGQGGIRPEQPPVANSGGGGNGKHLNAADFVAGPGAAGRALISWAQH